MRPTDAALAAALRDGGGVLRVADHSDLRRTLQRRVQDGELVQLLPGVLVPREQRGELDRVVAAVHAWDPDAVLTGAAAARLTFWPDLKVGTVTLSTTTQLRPEWTAVRPTRERLPVDLVLEESSVRLTAPALTALDLCASRGGAGIDEALRQHACSLEDMRQALGQTRHRPGNRLRRQLLHDSRDEPWSEAERALHQLLRRSRVDGWRANHRVACRGQGYALDLAFVGERVAVEVDGYEFHSKTEQFHLDRRRWSDLQSEGWLIVHLTPLQLEDDPGWVLDRIEQVREVARWSRQRR